MSKHIYIGKNCKVGFSWIRCREFHISENTKIGHLNFINVEKFKIVGGRIKHLNIIKGYMSVSISSNAWIHSMNRIITPYKNELSDKLPCFKMKEGSAVISNHLFDVTSDITIGAHSLIAGAGSQFWTHAFYMGRERNVRVDGDIVIGNNNYIGARSVICSGVTTGDYITIGANSTITKSLKESGLYVSQQLRFIPLDVEGAISKYDSPLANSVYKKKNK
jgi:acetyltransferase-like isoleucine patch superfamily enzyme